MGLAAVFFRDLALPYCVLCAAIAWRQGRRRELALWTLGLAAWLAFFAWHWWQISASNSGRRRASRKLDPVRRGGLCDFDGPDERLSAASAAMGDGHLSRGRAGRPGRLEHPATACASD